MIRSLMAALVATLVFACGDAQAQAQTASASEPAPYNPAAGAKPIAGDATYKAFHERDGIARIMADFVPRIAADPRIMRRFEGANLVRLQLMLTNQVCYLTGGPCEYGGRDMKTVHASFGLTDSDFNALAEDLQLSMDREKVPFAAQNQLLAKLAPMQRVIVTR